MTKNSYFGERALLFDEPRTATVEVSSPEAELWSIEPLGRSTAAKPLRLGDGERNGKTTGGGGNAMKWLESMGRKPPCENKKKDAGNFKDTWKFSGEKSHGNLSFLEAVIRDYRHKGDG